jgi:hypothetical protein
MYVESVFMKLKWTSNNNNNICKTINQCSREIALWAPLETPVYCEVAAF